MKLWIKTAAITVLVLCFSSLPVWAAQAEPTYLGKPLSFWLKSIETRDPDSIEVAFDAMARFGPEAWKAVPALTRIVSEPFVPVQIGSDSRAEILVKIQNIHLRAGAVDSLGAIGEASAPATRYVLQWALALRVLPPETRSAETDKLYVDLVAIDVLERMRVAGAVAQFGMGAAPAVQELLESPDPEERKLSVAILNSGALPIAAQLLKAGDCRTRTLGLSLMADLWPVIALEHLTAMKDMFACNAVQIRAEAGPTRDYLHRFGDLQ